MKTSIDKKHGEIFRNNLQGFMTDMGMSHLGTAKMTMD